MPADGRRDLIRRLKVKETETRINRTAVSMTTIGILEEAKGVKKTWAEIKTDVKNRVRRRILVEALCSAAE